MSETSVLVEDISSERRVFEELRLHFTFIRVHLLKSLFRNKYDVSDQLLMHRKIRLKGRENSQQYN